MKCPEKGGARLCGAPPRRIGSEPCRVGPPTRRGSSSKGPKQPKREQEERATSHWAPAMSHWPSNATWLEPRGSESPRKGAKRAHHVALGVRHVALDLQHDVARAPRVRIPSKRSKTSAPRRIVPPPCRVGPPTRCGSSSKAAKLPKRGQKERATSHWAPAMSRWTSNATWLPNFRLHRTVTGTDKRWRNHFGSRRGGLCVAVGSI